MSTLTINNSSFIIYVIYRPPPSQQNGYNVNCFLDEFAEFLSKSTVAKSEIIILGDVNIHLDVKTNTHTRRFIELLESNGFKQHVHEPTHYLGHTLDVLITRDTSDIVANVTVTDIGLCNDDGLVLRDHFAIVCDVKQQQPTTKIETVQYRNFKSINVELFRVDIKSSQLLSDTSGLLDDITHRYISGLSELIDIHAPLIKRTQISRPHAIWYNQTIREAKQLRRKLERVWRRTGLPAHHEDYRKQCSEVAKELYKAKCHYYSNKITDNCSDPKALSKIASSLLVNQHLTNLPASDDDSTLANNFSTFFSDKIKHLRSSFTVGVETDEKTLPFTGVKFCNLKPATADEVKKLILSYSNSSSQLDPVPTWLLKLCIVELLPIILTIMNASLRSGQFPSQFKNAIIRPLLKKSNLDVDQLKHYRPVSNTHFLSKILEKLVIGRLEDHMLKNLLYDPFQSAYRKQHSTETAILKVQNDIIASLDVGKCTVLGSLDLSAAFDTVDHHILLKRMRHLYGIDDTAWCWFESYLDNRHTKVRINDSLSSSRVLVCGVPQGSVLGARLYSMFIYPILNIIKKHGVHYHCYADDIQIYMKCKDTDIDIQESITRLQNCILEISNWMMVNSLKINGDKTEFIIFGNKPATYKNYSLKIGSSVIPATDCIKILGVSLDSMLNLNKHISNTCRTVYMHLRRINSIRPYLTEEAVKTLIQSVVISRLDYCNCIFVGMPLNAIRKLQLAHNAAARVVQKPPPRAHMTPILRQLHWLPVMKRCQFKLLTITFKSLHDDAPEYIQNLSEPVSPKETASICERHTINSQ